MTSNVASVVAGYQNQMQALQQGFYHVNRYMQYSRKDRVLAENANKYAALEGVVQFNDFMPENKKSMWTQPYTTFETVHLDGGVDVNNIAYGTICGGDTDMFNLKKGFKGVVSAFLGYNGNSSRYNGISLTQNGGLLGVSGSFYKGNFFTALTLSSGASLGEASTMYGRDSITLLSAGVANKTGYNFEFKDGRIIFQPSIFVGYTFINTFDYTNSAGVRMKHDPLNGIQIAPGFKLIGNTKNGWQPYLSFDVVMNFFPGNNQVKANDITLPRLSEKTYVQYGAGIQKSWKDVMEDNPETIQG